MYVLGEGKQDEILEQMRTAGGELFDVRWEDEQIRIESSSLKTVDANNFTDRV
jgi:hypothetical protein